MMEVSLPEGESASAAAAGAMAVGALGETPCGATPAAADSGGCGVEERPPPRCTSAAGSGAVDPAGTEFPLDPVSR
jgi:hypothetical protein